MHVDRLALLELVPDHDAIGDLVNQPLRGEMVPAADAEDHWNACRFRRAHIFNLLRAEIQQRRQQQQVGLMLAQDSFDRRAGRQRAFDGRKDPPP